MPENTSSSCQSNQHGHGKRINDKKPGGYYWGTKNRQNKVIIKKKSSYYYESTRFNS